MTDRPDRKLFRPVVVVPILALGVAAVFGWRLTRGPASVSSSEEEGPGASPAAVLRRMPDPVSYVSARAGKEDPATFNELVKAYGAWSSRPDALEARRQIVTALLAHPDIRIGLEALMTAVVSDQTPKVMDPMWPTLVQAVASHWDAVTFSLGRDMVALEDRPKAKDLLLDSLTEVKPDKLADSQKPLLASDLIDMYPGLRPDQKPGVEKALQALAGPDIVKILHGQGLHEGSTDLQMVVEKKQAVENVLKHPVPDKPAEE
jgi:hypothetical protein